MHVSNIKYIIVNTFFCFSLHACNILNGYVFRGKFEARDVAVKKRFTDYSLDKEVIEMPLL